MSYTDPRFTKIPQVRTFTNSMNEDWVNKFAVNSSGSNQVIGDYSGGEVYFEITPPDNEVYYLARLLVYVEDVGSFDSGSYGNGSRYIN